jgi:excisionase family DNA binding protein
MPRDWTLLTTSEVASQMSVKPSTVRLWIRRGELPVVTTWFRHAIQKADLEAFIEKRVKAFIERKKEKAGR